MGGHFQFKHEKSWDINTAPTLYDKYFEINMDNLSLALSAIPFHQRNSIDKSVFSETDILSMNNRATRFKQKYYNDKSYTTPEMEASDKILNSLKESTNPLDNITEEKSTVTDTNSDCKKESNIDNKEIVIQNTQDESKDILENTINQKVVVTNPVPFKVDETPLNFVSEDKLLNIHNIETKSEILQKIQDNNNKVPNVKYEEPIISKPEPQVPLSNTERTKTKYTDTNESKVVDNKEVDFDDFIFGKVEKKTHYIPTPVLTASKGM